MIQLTEGSAEVLKTSECFEKFQIQYSLVKMAIISLFVVGLGRSDCHDNYVTIAHYYYIK